ncbi:hypothetical protein ACN27G_08290 [Plantactinospora sp. WMMB334]|uniref:hypothetical protein n=1 Tax=Plantactinospora sp. WMMB334 TaxID=3404119 RepID=UPI003B933DA1
MTTTTELENVAATMPAMPTTAGDSPPLADLRESVAALLRYLADRVEPERDIETRPL